MPHFESKAFSNRDLNLNSALVMFVRALSGAGFDGAMDTSAPINPQVALNSSSSFWNTHGAIGESRWARLRSGVADTLWRCPALNEVRDGPYKI